MELEKEHFISGREYRDSTELLVDVAQRLISEGYAKPSLEQGLLSREKEFPTGIKAGISFAMPHAELDNVNRSTFAVIVPKRPVKFHNMIDKDEELDVQLVILLALKEKKEHLEFLQKITGLFRNAEKVRQVLEKAPDAQYAYFREELEGD